MAKHRMRDPHLDPSRVTAVGVYRYAVEFYAAAIATDERLGNEEGYNRSAPSPVNYLICHAIELGLKAYLIQRGVPHADLKSRKLGHDLERCLAAAIDNNLNELVTLSLSDHEVLSVANSLYANKEFDYILTGAKDFPVFGPLQTVAKKLVLGVAEAIPDSNLVLKREAGKILDPSQKALLT